MKTAKALGEPLSAVGMGLWEISSEWTGFNEKSAIRAVHAGIDAGITFLDTAPIYGKGQSEETLGKALKGRRDKVFLASKCGLLWNKKGKVRHNLSRGSLFQEIDQALLRLQTDYIDLWQVHWPHDGYSTEETFTALRDIQRKGKIRYIGVSNFSADRIENALSYADIASCQALYNLLEPNPGDFHGKNLEYRTEEKLLPFAQKEGLAFIAYSPLMQGLLAGKAGLGDIEDARSGHRGLQGDALALHLEKAGQLAELARALGLSLAELSIAWLVNQEAVTTVIAGSSSEKHIRENAAAADFVLNRESLHRIQEILKEKSKRG